jgi:prepilin-type N-terminal cleavage/methylation domain-containing protein
MQWRRDGFTLIELAVVLLIIAACVTVVFPKFSVGFLDRQRLRSSVSRIASIAEYAHQRAVCTHVTHLLHFDIEKGEYWVTAQTSDGKVTPIPDGLNLKGRLPEGAQFSGIEFRGTRADLEDVITIEFSPQGWIEPVTVYIASSKGGKMSVVINEMLGNVETFELLE